MTVDRADIRAAIERDHLDKTVAVDVLRDEYNDLIDRVHSALTSGKRWQLADGPCWCPCKREKAALSGRKFHTMFCQRAKALYAMEPKP